MKKEKKSYTWRKKKSWHYQYPLNTLIYHILNHIHTQDSWLGSCETINFQKIISACLTNDSMQEIKHENINIKWTVIECVDEYQPLVKYLKCKYQKFIIYILVQQKLYNISLMFKRQQWITIQWTIYLLL